MPKYGEYDYRHEPWELLAALAGIMEKGAAVPEAETTVRAIPRPIVYSVRDKGRQLIELLKERGDTPLQKLYDMAASRTELVATFISLLEMCAVGSVRLNRRKNSYIVHFAGGDTESILENMDYG